MPDPTPTTLGVTPTPTSTPNPFASPTPTPTETPFGYADWSTDTPTNTPTPTITPTGTLTPPDTPTPTWTDTPGISRSAMALLPTAYSNAWDRTDGWDWDIDFAYFIGDFADHDKSQQPSGFFNLEQLNLWLLTSDLKYGWLAENGDVPAIATGLMTTFLLQGGSSSSASSSNNQSFQLTGNSMAGLYTVLSKNIAPRSAVHFGYILGLKQPMSDIGLQAIAPNLNYSQFLPLLSTNLTTIEGDSRVGLFYTGFTTKVGDKDMSFEIWKPLLMPEDPVLLNSKIDFLPFAFSLGYERWDTGYALLGYFHFRFTIVPTTPSY